MVQSVLEVWSLVLIRLTRHSDCLVHLSKQRTLLLPAILVSRSALAFCHEVKVANKVQLGVCSIRGNYKLVSNQKDCTSNGCTSIFCLIARHPRMIATIDFTTTVVDLFSVIKQ